MKISSILLLFFTIVTINNISAENRPVITIDNDLQLRTISENVWIHISHIDLPKWGKVAANGMVVYTDKELVIVDTPWNDFQTQLLISWFENHYEVKDIKVLVTHYHDDNLGGLGWVHNKGIDSYSIKRTQDICKERGLPIPKNTIENNFIFEYHDIPLEIQFLGEGHTVDNISVYLPTEHILFGGCSVKALRNSSLGNTRDANIKSWPITLRNMKNYYSDTKIVIPGHGKEGSITLLDHTLSLF